MNGFIVVDKPVGITSHDVVSFVRRTLHMKKVGHTGTLDPFATGVLPVALGEATKAIPFLDESEKEYRAVMRLGISTDTQDCTGKNLREADFRRLSDAQIREVAIQFTGAIQQVPPMFSAVKQSGKPLYKLARQGIQVQREARDITIHSLCIEEINLPLVNFRVTCSRGTYVRTLASDMGDRLGCGAHLSELRRIKSGTFTLDGAIELSRLKSLADEGLIQEKVLTTYCALQHLRDMQLTELGAGKVHHGIVPGKADFSSFPEHGLSVGEMVRLSFAGRLIAVAENRSCDWMEEMKNMRLLRVFN